MAISNIFITELLYRSKLFKGVYSSNEKTPKLLHNESIIFNLSEKNKKGTHFIAACMKRKKIIMFDPLNMFAIIPEPICNYIRSHNVPIENNNFPIQAYSSDYCGYFCIAFVLLYNSLSLDEFLNLFYSDEHLLSLNDVIVLKIIYKILKK
jgi:hypothetical protein